MTTSKLSFYQQHLAIELAVQNKLKEKLERLEQEDFLYPNPKYNIVYKVTSKKDENQIFALSIKHGNQHPYGDEVIDIKNKTSAANPKSENQIELKKQFFIAYCFKQNILFSSNTYNSKLLLDTLFQENNIDIKINQIIHRIDDLKEKLESVSSITITKKPNIFNNNDFFTDTHDPEGLGQVATEIKLQLKFPNIKVAEVFDRVKNEYQKSNESFIIKGTNKNGDQAELHNNIFTKSISLDNLAKVKYGLYKEKDVLEKLIKKITELQNEKRA